MSITELFTYHKLFFTKQIRYIRYKELKLIWFLLTWYNDNKLSVNSISLFCLSFQFVKRRLSNRKGQIILVWTLYLYLYCIKCIDTIPSSDTMTNRGRCNMRSKNGHWSDRHTYINMQIQHFYTNTNMLYTLWHMRIHIFNIVCKCVFIKMYLFNPFATGKILLCDWWLRHKIRTIKYIFMIFWKFWSRYFRISVKSWRNASSLLIAASVMNTKIR